MTYYAVFTGFSKIADYLYNAASFGFREISIIDFFIKCVYNLAIVKRGVQDRMFWYWWVLIGIAAVVISVVVILFCISLAIHRKIFHRRYNGNKYVRYFKAEDFDGLHAEAVSFLSDRGQRLHGFIYHAEGVLPIGLILFSHGFGAGHQAYTTEIAALARAGFLVLAYDGTGCVASEGRMLGGFDQGAIDLRSALRFAAEDERLKGYKRVLVGHSWGAFSVMNALDTDVPIEGAAAMCGFVSCAGVIAQNTLGKCAFAEWCGRNFFRLFNRIRFGKFANYDSIRSLRKTEKPLLLLYGEQDKTVHFDKNGARVRDAVRGKENIRYLSYPQKGHNVYLTVQAETYMHETFGTISEQLKKDRTQASALYGAVDYRRMTEEDPAVMNILTDFCRSLVE